MPDCHTYKIKEEYRNEVDHGCRGGCHHPSVIVQQFIVLQIEDSLDRHTIHDDAYQGSNGHQDLTMGKEDITKLHSVSTRGRDKDGSLVTSSDMTIAQKGIASLLLFNWLEYLLTC